MVVVVVVEKRILVVVVGEGPVVGQGLKALVPNIGSDEIIRRKGRMVAVVVMGLRRGSSLGILEGGRRRTRRRGDFGGRG